MPVTAVARIRDVTKQRTGRTIRTGAKYRSWVLVKCVWCGAYYWFSIKKRNRLRFSCISDLHVVTLAAYSV